MNTSELHGKQIQAIYWPDTESEQGRHLLATENKLLEMSVIYHGDSDEYWILEFEKINEEFTEIARHNLRYVESFSWA